MRGVALGAARPAAAAPPDRTPTLSAPVDPRTFPVPLSRVAPRAAATYTVKDVGAPSTTLYSSFGSPVKFSGTGRLVGQGYPASGYQHCTAYTGSTFVDFEGANTLNCYASNGVSDATTTGTFGAVGYTYLPTDEGVVGFYETIAPSTATLKTFSSNVYSELYAMNATGLAAGYTYYSPYGGFATGAPAVTTTGTTLALLQPTCTAYAVPYCVYYPYYYTSNGGARAITKTGTVLAFPVNGTNGNLIEVPPAGSRSHPVQFTLPTVSGNEPFDNRGKDDNGNVVYEEYNSSAKKYFAFVYSPATKTSRNLGSLAGNSCTQYTPLYMNGPGRVLGYTTGCSFAGDQTFFTWDATYGMVAITFNHTNYSSVNFYLINDNGQFAGDFYTTTGVHHWGYLTPPLNL